MKIHESVTEDRVMALCGDSVFGIDNPGICLECGADHDACEPDAENYQCYECGENAVHGVEQILLSGYYH